MTSKDPTVVADSEEGPLATITPATVPQPPSPPTTIPVVQLLKYLTRVSFQVERSIKEMAELHTDITKQISQLEGVPNHAG